MQVLVNVAALIPLVLVGATWWVYRKDGESLAPWRKVLFLTGLVCVLVSAVCLVSFTIHAYVISRGTKPFDLDRAYPVLSKFGLGLLSAILASFGQHVSRLFLLGTGSDTAIFWYVAALAASY